MGYMFLFPAPALLGSGTALSTPGSARSVPCRDYIFFDPHPGFAAGRAENEWLGAWCHTLKNSVQLVADRGARHYCEDTRDMPGLLGVPYVSSFRSHL